MTRLELVRPKSVGFKPTASASSATRQYGRRCMIRTCTIVTPRVSHYHPSMCRAVSTSSTKRLKIPNQSLENYSGVLAPTSSMLFLARSMPYRTSHVPSIVELFIRSEAAYPSVTAAVKYCREPLCYGNVCSTTQYGQSKSWLSLTACLSILDQQDSTLIL